MLTLVNNSAGDKYTDCIGIANAAISGIFVPVEIPLSRQAWSLLSGTGGELQGVGCNDDDDESHDHRNGHAWLDDAWDAHADDRLNDADVVNDGAALQGDHGKGHGRYEDHVRQR